MTIKQTVKNLVSRWPMVKSAAFVADDLIWGLKLATGTIGSDTGATHLNLSESESLSYIEEVFADYKKYGTVDKFYGSVAELGPGDNAGVALLMRKDGCDRVDLIDRFLSHRDSQQQAKIYSALSQQYQLDEFKTKDEWDEKALAGIDWRVGEPAEIYFQKCAQNRGGIYDFIISRAVLEHLYNPLDTLRYMVACLKPGGKLLHKIDCRDHGLYTPEHHELTFLEIPTPIYRLMSRNAGRPNRITIDRYRNLLSEMKQSGAIDYSLLVTHLVAVGDILPHQEFDNIDPEQQRQAIAFVDSHRSKFADEFRDVDSRDLAVSGVFLIATKR
ncbi:MAG: class I SAM-dependent methyltransferase [Cyanosarcina radialis HA8281-LM2]|jgi:SAM-dependent methyltransferase|nr:class I SAM-dependent methyltransferase [Cyanosarcina radialis HA8281-LM2]